MNRLLLYSLLILMLVISYRSFGQKKEAKEEYKSFKRRSSISSTSNVLSQGEALKEKDTNAALDKVREALAMSIAEGDIFNEGKCYLLLGEINANIQEWKLAFENFNRAKQTLEKSYSNTPQFIKALMGLANTEMELLDYQNALLHLEQAKNFKPDKFAGDEIQLLMSEVYYRMGNYQQSAKALDDILPSKISDASFETRVQNQRAKIYARSNDFDKTKQVYDKSVNVLRSSSKPSMQAQKSLEDAKDEIAGVLHEQEKYDDEIAIREQAVVYNTESKNFSAVSKDKVAIGNTLLLKDEEEAGLRQLKEAAAIADSLNAPAEQAHAYLALAVAYQKNDRKDQALAAYKKYSDAVKRNEELNKVKLTEHAELIKKQKDIEELSKDVSIGQREDTIERQTVYRQKLIIYGLLFIILVVVVTSYFIYKNARASKIANQLLALKSLRSQMNPHFIFNALNSVNHFISQQDERTANKFLSEFSQLMRLVLENSQEDFIPLYKEQEILSLYLKLEHYRFRDKFEYEISIDENINAESILVPPMLIQPYIENAVWHGLRYKESKGKLSLNIHQNHGNLIVEVIDDGIGRKRSAELKTVNQKKHNSTGLKNIQERLTIINKVYHTHYRVEVTDLNEGLGTSVRLYLPRTKSQKVI